MSPEGARPLTLRPERPDDAPAIAALTRAAFAGAPHASGREAEIVAALRAAGALALSLVVVEGADVEAGEGGEVVGHVAFSPAAVGAEREGWLALGPISVGPDRQGRGIGSALVRAGLSRLRLAGARGCVLLGDPGYYGRFGLMAAPGLTFGGAPSPYLQAVAFGSADAVAFGSADAAGEVAFHPAFGVG